MPLKGFLCALNGTEQVDADDCIACACAAVAPRGMRCHYTPSILAGIAGNRETRKSAGISATGLVGCLRQTYLGLTREFYQHPDRLYPAYRGTMFHALFEKAPQGDGTIRERRYSRAVAGITITGQMDEVNPERGIILDYKSKRSVPSEVQPEHTAQLNIYRWIIANGRDHQTGEPIQVDVTTLGIVYATMSEVRKVLVEVWPLDVTEAYVSERAAILAAALAGGRVPDRIVPNPTKRALCYQGWCPHYAECIDMGAGDDQSDDGAAA